MEDIDLSDHKVTSEVHVFSEGEPLGDDKSIGTSRKYESYKSRFCLQYVIYSCLQVHSNFKFTLPANYQRQNVAQGGNPCDNNVAVVDKDGDPIIHRRNHTDDHSLTISICNNIHIKKRIKYDSLVIHSRTSCKHQFRSGWFASVAWSTFVSRLSPTFFNRG